MSQDFIIPRPDGSELRVSGYKAAAPPPGTQAYAASESIGELPPRVDLRPFMTTVENQGALNSCVANAVAGAYEYLVKRHLGDDAYDVSRLFVYFNARAADGAEHEDEGAIISSAIAGLRDYGACSEETWPYEQDRVNASPHDDAYDEAAGFLIEDFQHVPTDLDAWRHALAEGYPIIFGMLLYQSFDAQRRPGLVPMPTPDEAGRAAHGGHAMLAVGYSDPDELFIVRNSWGEAWGDGGYCYIPYRYLMHPQLNGGDSWIVRRIEPLDYDEGWEEEDESMLDELDTILGRLDDEDWGDFLDDLGDIPLETRLAALFLYAANADGEVSDEEWDALVAYLEHTLELIGSPFDAGAVLEHAVEVLDGTDVVAETVEILGRHLDPEGLAAIAGDLEDVIGVDGLSEDEDNLVWELVSAWQLGDGEDDEDDEDWDDEDDEDDEELDEEDDEDWDDEDDEAWDDEDDEDDWDDDGSEADDEWDDDDQDR